MEARPRTPMCPSSRPEEDGAIILGVVGGTVTEPRVGYLRRPIPASAGFIALDGPVTPTEVFRFSAPCRESACPQFRSGRCQIGVRMVRILPTVVDQLPACSIRPDCRWWQQEGKGACLRCPAIVTDNYSPSPEMRQVAGVAGDPGAVAHDLVPRKS